MQGSIFERSMAQGWELEFYLLTGFMKESIMQAPPERRRELAVAIRKNEHFRGCWSCCAEADRRSRSGMLCNSCPVKIALQCHMLKSAKLVAIRRRGRQVLLVRRRKDKLWMFPGGRRKKRTSRESAKACLRRELKEELPKLKFGRFRLWRSLGGKNRYSGKKMSDAVFIASARGTLRIGAPKEIDKAAWRSPWSGNLTPTSRHIRDKLASTRHIKRR